MYSEDDEEEEEEEELGSPKAESSASVSSPGSSRRKRRLFSPDDTSSQDDTDALKTTTLSETQSTDSSDDAGGGPTAAEHEARRTRLQCRNIVYKTYEMERAAKASRINPNTPTEEELEARLRRRTAKKAYHEALKIEEEEYRKRKAREIAKVATEAVMLNMGISYRPRAGGEYEDAEAPNRGRGGGGGYRGGGGGRSQPTQRESQQPRDRTTVTAAGRGYTAARQFRGNQEEDDSTGAGRGGYRGGYQNRNEERYSGGRGRGGYRGGGRGDRLASDTMTESTEDEEDEEEETEDSEHHTNNKLLIHPTARRQASIATIDRREREQQQVEDSTLRRQREKKKQEKWAKEKLMADLQETSTADIPVSESNRSFSGILKGGNSRYRSPSIFSTTSVKTDCTMKRADELDDDDIDLMDKKGRLPGDRGYTGPARKSNAKANQPEPAQKPTVPSGASSTGASKGSSTPAGFQEANFFKHAREVVLTDDDDTTRSTATPTHGSGSWSYRESTYSEASTYSTHSTATSEPLNRSTGGSSITSASKIRPSLSPSRAHHRPHVARGPQGGGSVMLMRRNPHHHPHPPPSQKSGTTIQNKKAYPKTTKMKHPSKGSLPQSSSSKSNTSTTPATNTAQLAKLRADAGIGVPSGRMPSPPITSPPVTSGTHPLQEFYPAGPTSASGDAQQPQTEKKPLLQRWFSGIWGAGRTTTA
eukprot:TRINITY_DN66734_c8_g17_i1.p1 TRINITY_DN66734_c8_g17~~TRINITY_DN66734_c8_g17_i1.p1  ORF type:complete len:729 (-),score=85.43 TRINITY_DN66734_c8_g17_i1:1311-3422(-)